MRISDSLPLILTTVILSSLCLVSPHASSFPIPIDMTEGNVQISDDTGAVSIRISHDRNWRAEPVIGVYDKLLAERSFLDNQGTQLSYSRLHFDGALPRFSVTTSNASGTSDTKTFWLYPEDEQIYAVTVQGLAKGVAEEVTFSQDWIQFSLVTEEATEESKMITRVVAGETNTPVLEFEFKLGSFEGATTMHSM